MSIKRFTPIPIAALFEVAGAWLCMLVITLVGTHLLLGTLAEHENRRTQESRMLVALSQVRDDIENSLGLGFAIAEVPQAQQLLETKLGKEPALLAIDIFDHQGAIRFSTDRSSIGELAPQDWRKPRNEDTFSAAAGDDRVLAVALRGSFSEIEGYLVATYRPATPIQGDASRLFVAVLSLALVALLAAAWALAPFRREIEAALAAMKGESSKADDPPSAEITMALSRLEECDQRFAEAFGALEQEERQT